MLQSTPKQTGSGSGMCRRKQSTQECGPEEGWLTALGGPPRPRGSRVRANRSGSTYVLVVGIAVVASSIALGALSISSVKRRTADLERDFLQAGQVAESGVELALAQTAFIPGWRSDLSAYQDGVFTDPVQLGRGHCQWSFFDPADGDITNNPSDPVRIIGHATYGNSSRTFSVAAVQTGRSLDVLRTAIHADGTLTVDDTLICGMGPVSANTEIDLTGGQIVGAAEAPLIANTGNIEGSFHEGAPEKTMPAASLFEIYKTMATIVAIDDLSPANVLTGYVDATSNPGGTEINSDAVYFVSVPTDTTLRIENCRIRGSLLVELTGANSKLNIGQGVIWEPHRSGLPALVAYTDNDSGTSVDITCDGGFVDGTNDGDASLKGLFHIIRNVADPVSKTTIAAKNPIVGSIVVDGDCLVTGVNRLVANWNLVSQPPVGYTTAVDPSNRINNGTMSDGLLGWVSTSRNPNGFDTQVSPQFIDGSEQILVSDRPAASSGVFQDVTQWIGSGELFSGSIDVRTESTTEDVNVILEYATRADGIQKLVASGSATAAGTNIAFSFTPAWTGKLLHARLLINSTVSRQNFSIDNALIADTRLIKPANLVALPTTWKMESSGE